METEAKFVMEIQCLLHVPPHMTLVMAFLGLICIEYYD